MGGFMGDVKLGKGNIVYDDALDRTLLSEGDDIFRSFRIYKYGDDFIYYEVIWDGNPPEKKRRK